MRRLSTCAREVRDAFRACRFAHVLRRVTGQVNTKPSRAWCGQSSVEYAVVLAAFLALVVALGAVWRLFEDGTVTLHALQSASHHLKDAAMGAWGDVFLY